MYDSVRQKVFELVQQAGNDISSLERFCRIEILTHFIIDLPGCGKHFKVSVQKNKMPMNSTKDLKASTKPECLSTC